MVSVFRCLLLLVMLGTGLFVPWGMHGRDARAARYAPPSPRLTSQRLIVGIAPAGSGVAFLTTTKEWSIGDNSEWSGGDDPGVAVSQWTPGDGEVQSVRRPNAPTAAKQGYCGGEGATLAAAPGVIAWAFTCESERTDDSVP